MSHLKGMNWRLLALVFLLLPTVGCLNKIPAVAHYQATATEKCLAAGHTAEQCKPLPYPSSQSN